MVVESYAEYHTRYEVIYIVNTFGDQTLRPHLNRTAAAVCRSFSAVSPM